MASSKDNQWFEEYQHARTLAEEIAEGIQERNETIRQGQQPSRQTAALRRKIAALNSSLRQLDDALTGPGPKATAAADAPSQNERARRRDMLALLRTRRDELDHLISRSQTAQDRAGLMGAAAADGAAPRGPGARETAETADLDNRGILQLQQRVMEDQDRSLEDMAKTVSSTKHIAVAINGELDLQVRLLDEIDGEVQNTHARMTAAQVRMANVFKRSGGCMWTCGVASVIAALITLIILLIKH